MLIRGVEVPTNDLNQRYADNFIELKLPDTKIPEIVQTNIFKDGQVQIRRQSKGRNIFNYNEVQLLREFPRKLGAIQFEKAVHFIRREPYRQWKRGLNPGAITDYCRKPGVVHFHDALNLKKAEALFNPKFLPWREQFPLLRKEQMYSVAYNHRFWFSGNKRTIYLWYEEIPVGEVKEDVLFFNPECQVLRQEIADEFKNEFKII